MDAWVETISLEEQTWRGWGAELGLGLLPSSRPRQAASLSCGTRVCGTEKAVGERLMLQTDTQQHTQGAAVPSSILRAFNFLHNPFNSNRPCSVYCISPAGNFCSTQNPKLSRTVSSGFGIYTIGDMCGEVLIIAHRIVLKWAGHWKADWWGFNPVLDPVWPWDHFWISLSFSSQSWKMEEPKNTSSKDTLAITLFPLL